jgi:hypothetical protein
VDPSPQVPSGPDIATLRIFDLYELMQWMVHADDHDKTVLDGFSSLGGLSSFVNTLFSAIFGTTLLLVMLGECDLGFVNRECLKSTPPSGRKSISLFGIAQRLNREQIIQAVRRKYPKLGQEKSEGGLLAWIHDHLIDLGPLEGHIYPVRGEKDV